MHKIDEIVTDDGSHERRISFWEGNPADLTPGGSVDLMIVSAFRDDYSPTEWSIIVALDRKGLSVAELAKHKAVDLRTTNRFWLSAPLPIDNRVVGANRIPWFEPHFLDAYANEVVGQLFRGADKQGRCS